MKTTKFRLLATIITLAAVITATTIPANAQRRSTQDNEKSKKVETKHSERKSNVEKKSTFKDNAIEPKANNRSVSSNREVKRNNSQAANKTTREENRNSTRSTEDQNKRSTINDQSNNSNQNRSDGRERNDSRKNNGNVDNNSKTNNDDARYKPNRDYRGSDKYWSPEFRGENRGKNHFDKNYRWHKYNHWDRNWETYRWNHNSWRNYYGFYDSYSYRNHKHYYHHHYYGHVIRRFVYRPQIYIHNHTRYYCYDGFFFRHRSGVGYVLVDIPFGFAFDYLPDDYERVYINGYLYFRVGNLFFENTGFGFSLVHYPERYFSYNDGYYNGGFRFNDMNF